MKSLMLAVALTVVLPSAAIAQWTSAFGKDDMKSLPNDHYVVSSITIPGGFVDIRAVWNINLETPPVGSFMGVYLVPEGVSPGEFSGSPQGTPLCILFQKSAAPTTQLDGMCLYVYTAPGRLVIYNGAVTALSKRADDSHVEIQTSALQ